MTQVEYQNDKTEARKKESAWYDYCITNRLIAYGEVPSLTEEQIEARCKAQLEKDYEAIRRGSDAQCE